MVTEVEWGGGGAGGGGGAACSTLEEYELRYLLHSTQTSTHLVVGLHYVMNQSTKLCEPSELLLSLYYGTVVQTVTFALCCHPDSFCRLLIAPAHWVRMGHLFTAAAGLVKWDQQLLQVE